MVMALTAPCGFRSMVKRDLRIPWVLDAPFVRRRVCFMAAGDRNASSSSSSSSSSLRQQQSRLSMEISSDKWKKNMDLVHLPEPLSSTCIQGSVEDSKFRVAYKGLPGAFSEVAALKAYPGSATVPYDQFEVVFEALETWVVDKAVLPIENSVTGSIHRNYDLLLRHQLHIVGEVQLAVSQCLMALPGVEKKDLKRVLSHPQALSQCEAALNKLEIIQENTDSTAAAARLVSSKKLCDAGAIASHRAAQIYGLMILEEGIEDFPNNVTRFMILARNPIIPRIDRPFKTSIAFTLEEGPGMLFKVLAVFALRNINLSKIESRPQKTLPLRVVDDSKRTCFNYLFHVDFEASLADLRVKNALSHLQEYVSFCRVLGSYPRDTFAL
ncbi:arogenate dehydratase/prephenate dehydratase 1, chloroplastic-like [Phalaenopsis equestris]|uniref:arogenate dehydratase/prephenate dehydratase 1, chloroplastic-like n=1 Tax=Phalaenopsis equestris TaxID=78828 RepID=UPI0009E3F827|nr:arogenate dehydratase/prephenate dehydratase 1, chloroplastic-like [Phalaenopsis equestris]XP_020592621.1 arogenate dehydratase/prephenate dehydratase 1, chloroplastic-like [Phalaenopsis equestris]